MGDAADDLRHQEAMAAAKAANPALREFMDGSPKQEPIRDEDRARLIEQATKPASAPPESDEEPEDYSLELLSRRASEEAQAELEWMRRELRAPIPKEWIFQRPAPGQNKKLSYIAGIRVILELCRILGPDRFSFRVLATELFTTNRFQKRGDNGPYEALEVVFRARVRLTTYWPNGTVCNYEDVGWGIQEAPSGRAVGPMYETAEKTAVTDAMKRCARLLGRRTGSGLYAQGANELEPDLLEVEDLPVDDGDKEALPVPQAGRQRSATVKGASNGSSRAARAEDDGKPAEHSKPDPRVPTSRAGALNRQNAINRIARMRIAITRAGFKPPTQDLQSATDDEIISLGRELLAFMREKNIADPDKPATTETPSGPVA